MRHRISVDCNALFCRRRNAFDWHCFIHSLSLSLMSDGMSRHWLASRLLTPWMLPTEASNFENTTSSNGGRHQNSFIARQSSRSYERTVVITSEQRASQHLSTLFEIMVCRMARHCAGSRHFHLTVMHCRHLGGYQGGSVVSSVFLVQRID